MKTRIIVVLALCLSACSVKVQDERASREELAAAFQQRDEVLKQYATILKDHEVRLNQVAPKPKPTEAPKK